MSHHYLFGPPEGSDGSPEEAQVVCVVFNDERTSVKLYIGTGELTAAEELCLVQAPGTAEIRDLTPNDAFTISAAWSQIRLVYDSALPLALWTWQSYWRNEHAMLAQLDADTNKFAFRPYGENGMFVKPKGN